MFIDLRSDTVTLPTQEMLAAIPDARLGDDVRGEDPTVQGLEAEAAQTIGLEAALFLPTGTMANLCALLTHCGRGQRVVVGDQSHIFYYEAGGASALGGIAYHPVPNLADGGLDSPAVSAVLAVHGRSRSDPHLAPVGLIAFECTHNRCGGVVPSLESLRAIAAQARGLGIPVHLDGARIFNAAIALGVEAKVIAQVADSVQFCLSKGLAAPVGSILAGSAAFIQRARHTRKMLGGGMRQAGVVAAPGLVALRTMIPRLAEDHARAAELAEGLRSVRPGALEVQAPQTNIVFFKASSAAVSNEALAQELRNLGVGVGAMGPWIRAVTHHGIARADVEAAVRVVPEALDRTASRPK